MKIFTASLATETNTFGPMPTGLDSFYSKTYFESGTHPPEMQMYSGPLWAARQVCEREDWQLHEGLVTTAVPSGMVSRQAYETLRNKILSNLQQALPVDIVVLGLHGAMVAEGYPDCEGDLLHQVRELVGKDTVLGATLDPHSHLSERMVNSADILICWKEYPHTDIKERAEELLDICVKCAQKSVRPQASVVETQMIAIMHTTRPPASDLVRHLYELEKIPGVLSASIVHGFPWADVPDMGTKALIYTDSKVDHDGSLAKQLSADLAKRIVSLRSEFVSPLIGIKQALEEAAELGAGTIVLADSADNAGGGAASDSTFILRYLLDNGITDAAIAPIWDPSSVKFAFEVGVGSTLDIRVGGKISPYSGDPVDSTWEVVALRRDLMMTGLAGTPARLGDSALLRSNGVLVVVTSLRGQAINTDLFTQLGCDPSTLRLVIVKSSQHFYESFSKIALKVIYVDTPGTTSTNMSALKFHNINRPMWPMDA